MPGIARRRNTLSPAPIRSTASDSASTSATTREIFAQHLGVQQLFAVVPLGTAQWSCPAPGTADAATRAGHRCQRSGQFRLADARRALQ